MSLFPREEYMTPPTVTAESCSIVLAILVLHHLALHVIKYRLNLRCTGKGSICD